MITTLIIICLLISYAYRYIQVKAQAALLKTLLSDPILYCTFRAGESITVRVFGIKTTTVREIQDEPGN